MMRDSLALALAASLAWSTDAGAQGSGIINTRGLQPSRDYLSALPYEHVDPLSGALILTFTDLVLQPSPT